MPTNTEFAIHLENRPGTLAQVCRALADRNVNILALQASPAEGKSQVRLVTDNVNTTKTILDNEHLSHTQTQVAQLKLANRPGELARAAARLGDANININYVYSGLESNTNSPVLIFGVADAGQASTILEQSAASAARK
jgi:hypothetical protein